MSSKSVKKRNIIQKLDFENCIITNIKTASKGRKKFRARITREIEDCTDTSEEHNAANQRTKSPVLIPKPQAKQTSPVFMSNCKNRNAICKRKASDIPSEKFSDESIFANTFSSSSVPSSPVFKTFKKHKANVSLSRKYPTPEKDVYETEETSFSQIDEFTLESKQSVNISSVGSENVKNSDSCEVFSDKTAHCSQLTCEFKTHNTESLKPTKKNTKKNSLLCRLQKLHQKQASEKLLWQHQKLKQTTGSLKISIVDFWKEDFKYILKCQSPFIDNELTFAIVDCRWVPGIKIIKKGSVLYLYPPWQTLIVSELKVKILLNIICLDILEETEDFGSKEITFEVVPKEEYEADEKLLINSLFFADTSGFLY